MIFSFPDTEKMEHRYAVFKGDVRLGIACRSIFLSAEGGLSSTLRSSGRQPQTARFPPLTFLALCG
jgi:hypothetical protein